MAHLHALLVGVNAYSRKPLGGCVNDALAWKGHLEELAGKGGRLSLELLLDGDATRRRIIEAFRGHLGQARTGDTALFCFSGHGSREPAPPPYAAEEPGGLSETLAGCDLWDLPADLRPDLLGLAPEPFLAPTPVAVELRSPTHLLLRGKPVRRGQPIPFDLLIKSTFDRFAGLYGEEASPALAQPIRSVVEAEAAKVPLVEQDLRPAEGSHLSKRSQARLDLGGTVGRLRYGPQAASFFHILRAAEILHLGKNPTFGCGRVQVGLA